MVNYLGHIKKIDIYSLALGLCIGILPWSEKWNTVSIILLALLLFFNLFWLKTKVNFNIGKFLAASALFWISLIWLLNTDDNITGWKYMERISSSLVFPVVFSLTLAGLKIGIRRVLFIFMGSCMLRYLFFLAQFIDWELVYILDYWKEVLIQFNQIALTEALHPSYFTLYLGFCVLASFYFLSKAPSFKRRTGWFILLLIYFLMVVSLGAKMPLVACVFAILTGVLYNLYRIKSGRIKYVALVFSSLLIVALFLLKVPNGILQDVDNYYRFYKGEEMDRTLDYEQYGTSYSFETWSKTNRIYIWKSSAELFKNNFLFGVGTGDIQNELNNQYLMDGQEYLAKRNTNTHNQFLDFLIKFGILGFLGVIIFLWYFIKYALSGTDGFYLMFLVFVLLCMLTENILNRQLGIVFFFFFNSLFLFRKEKPVCISNSKN
ncbi:O-antigen ligase family protein [Maribacter aurantiacus]|uniref:O-antigen ligase family protein n=1 Tax=Maribacter aurantiacus TaxID=1882343 RepID=A0A5R8MA91_9FLAO|nr:O-antigen ligase family protein [Maribacter aurantiacus]TLF46471.1 O-antigen ligase family protein [Maribacter aurantiacus]